jgi:sugar lactone lactonase YvrE
MLRKVLARGALALLALAVGFLVLAPTDVEPVAWTPPPAPSLSEGPYAANDRLAAVERIAALGGHGPESVAPDGKGSLCTGLLDGRIVRMALDGGRAEVLTATAGRPLGMAFHPDGSLIVCDAKRGLYRVAPDGAERLLADSADGVPFRFTDDVSITRDGRYAYFTDASSKRGWGRHAEDILEHGGHGRLLRHDFETGATTTLVRGIQFANGVALGPGDAYVLFDETGSYRVRRYWISGPRAGTEDVFAEDLPGHPDNITFNGRDTFWVALFSPRDPFVDGLAGSPFLRKMVARAMTIAPVPVARRAMVLGLDLEGRVSANLQHPGRESYSPITSAREVGEWLYLGSLERDSLARVRLSSVR